MHLLTFAMAAVNALLFTIGGFMLFSSRPDEKRARVTVVLSQVFALALLGANLVGVALVRQADWQALSADLIFAASIGLFVSAGPIVRQKNFAFLHTAHSSSELVTNGPYRYIRHPIYSAYLLFGLASLVAAPRLVQAAILIMMLLIYVISAAQEEKELGAVYPGYRRYKQRTWRFIPFIH